MLNFLQSTLDTLKDKLFNNVIVGKMIIVINENFDAQINKIFKNNIKSVSSSNTESILYRKNYRRIRVMQATEN